MRLLPVVTATCVALAACSSAGGDSSASGSGVGTTAGASGGPSGAGASSGNPTGAPSALTTRSAAPSVAVRPVALPARHRWMPLPALHTRLALPTTWKVLDLTTLREQRGTPAFAKTAASLGYTEQELADFAASGAVAMAVGPDAGDTAPNLLVRSVAGESFADGDHLTAAARGATGVLDDQSEPACPAGPCVRGDFHAPLDDGTTAQISQLAVTVDGQQDLITVAAADAATRDAVMDTVAATYTPIP
ncbi:hypothetical protein [Arsenicicoccus dermatophilus]|uniref:hypothetical protein n=1 Tax=Arsenicicoccus dermatophilus TaxID=1076331 RepID=UPI0039174E50